MKALMNSWPGALERLFDIDTVRLRDMDEGKVSLQVISHCVTEDPSPEVCRLGNDHLAKQLQETTKGKGRFAGFAVLPMSQPAVAAVELERSVKELGFVGALVDQKVRSKFFDGSEYDVFWEKAQELDVPIYMHPSWPSAELFAQSYAGNYSAHAMSVVGGAMWGWHSEVGLHILRLHTAGVFDKFPKLKLIIGHFGEMIPYMLQRIIDQESVIGRRKRPFNQVYDENLWITTSGVYSLDPMRCILKNTRIDRILYSIDYPFTTNAKGLKWIEELEKSGLVTSDQLELIAYRNAESLLGIKAQEIQFD